MNKMGGLFKIISQKLINILAIFIILFIFIINILYTSYTYSSWYPLIFTNTFISSASKIIIGVFLILLVLFIINKLKEKMIFTMFICINLIAIIIKFRIIESFENFPIADSWLVFNGANVLFFTDDIRLLYAGGYFALYPQQLGITTILYPLAYFFRENINFYFLTQVFIIQLIIILLSIASFKLRGLKALLITTIILNLFIPNYFVTFLIYGDLYAYMFITLSFLLYLFSEEIKGNLKYLVYIFIFIFIVLAYLARLSTNIFVIAIMITIFLKYKINWKIMSIQLILLSTIILPIGLLTKSFDTKDVGLGKSAFPTSTWFRIGLGYSGFDNVTPGFHDMNLDNEFMVLGYDTEEMDKINKKVISDRIQSLSNEKQLFNFLYKKSIIMWTDPDFEMMTLILPFKGSKIEDPYKAKDTINYGFGKLGLEPKNRFGEFLWDNYYQIRKFEKIYIFPVYIFMLILFLANSKDDKYVLFQKLLLIGFFLLHLLIEIKSRYVYVFINSTLFILSLYLNDYYLQLENYVKNRILTKKES